MRILCQNTSGGCRFAGIYAISYVIFISCKIGKILCLNELCRDKPYNFRLGECPGCRFAGSEASDRHQCGPTSSPTCAAGLGPSPSLTKYIWKFCFRNLVWDPNRCIYVTTVIQIPDILNFALYVFSLIW